jgi:hypothetical protein
VTREPLDAGKVIDFRFDEPYDDEEDSRKAVSLMKFIAKAFKDGYIAPELVAFAQDKLHLRVNRGYWTEEQYRRAQQRKAVYHRDETLENMPQDEFAMFLENVVAKSKAEKAAEAVLAAQRAAEAAEVAETAEAETEKAAGPEGPVETGEPGKPAEVAESPAAEAVTEAEAQPAVAAGPAKPALAEKPSESAEAPVRKEAKPLPRREDPFRRPESAFFREHGGRNDMMWARLERGNKSSK